MDKYYIGLWMAGCFGFTIGLVCGSTPRTYQQAKDYIYSTSYRFTLDAKSLLAMNELAGLFRWLAYPEREPPKIQEVVYRLGEIDKMSLRELGRAIDDLDVCGLQANWSEFRRLGREDDAIALTAEERKLVTDMVFQLRSKCEDERAQAAFDKGYGTHLADCERFLQLHRELISHENASLVSR